MVTRTKKIFVGGLSAPTTLEDVKNYFEQFGPVSINISIKFTLLRCIEKLKLCVSHSADDYFNDLF